MGWSGFPLYERFNESRGREWERVFCVISPQVTASP